jgi:hypothetical protein
MGRFIWFLCSDSLAAMVLGNYVIKDMGGNIQDAFGGMDLFYYQWQLPVWNIIYHRNNE